MLDVFGAQIVTLVMVKPGLIVKRSGAFKIFVHSEPHHVNATISPKEAHFSIRPSREALDPESISELSVKPFSACHPKNTRANLETPVNVHMIHTFFFFETNGQVKWTCNV